jgi:hypothetical protein
VPVIVRLQHCVIAMYFRDHNPPHFHVVTPDAEAQMALASLELMEGSVDRRALREARAWAEEHRDELWAKWDELNP